MHGDLNEILRRAGLDPIDDAYEEAVESFLYDPPDVVLGRLNESTGLYELSLRGFNDAIKKKVIQGGQAIKKKWDGDPEDWDNRALAFSTDLLGKAADRLKDNPVQDKVVQMVKDNPKLALFGAATLAVVATTALGGMDPMGVLDAIGQVMQGGVDDMAASIMDPSDLTGAAVGAGVAGAGAVANMAMGNKGLTGEPEAPRAPHELNSKPFVPEPQTPPRSRYTKKQTTPAQRKKRRKAQRRARRTTRQRR